MRSRAAFSMFELAIVIVIVGLLMGGVLVGQSMMRGSQVRRVLTDATSYAGAMHQFRMKYGDFPGDFPTAASIWATTIGGDGDGIIEPALAANATGENYRFWQQLSLAGMIGGTYTGLAGPNNRDQAVGGTNTPIGPMELTTFWANSWLYRDAADGNFFEGDYNNIIVFGGQANATWPTNRVLSGPEALNMDQKSDDSYPATGTIRSRKDFDPGTAPNPDCTTTTAPTTARYDATNPDTRTCVLIFMGTFMAPQTR